jgi:PEGA domain
MIAPARAGWFRCLLRLPLVLLATLPAGRAAAQSAADLDRAKESFKAGAIAYGAGEYLAAIQALDAAYASTPLPAIAFSLAQAERRQYFVAHERAHLDRAVTLFRRYLNEVPSGGRRADALEALSQLEPLAALQDHPGAAPAGEEATAVRPTRVMITADAPGARLSLDGGAPTGSPLIREVEPGRHRVAISAAGFAPEEHEVTAVAAELIPLSIALRELPSTVMVNAPSTADLYVDGVFASRGGLTLRLPGGAHGLAAGQKGQRVWSASLDLGRGVTRTVPVSLEPTRQRRASRLLFAGAAAAAGAGVVLSALAVRAQGRAEDFLTRQTRGNVSAADRDGYDRDVATRDHDRIAAAVTLGVAAGLAVTALFLREIDQPDAQELSRRSRPPERGPGMGTAALVPRRMAPALLGRGYGAVVGGTF